MKLSQYFQHSSVVLKRPQVFTIMKIQVTFFWVEIPACMAVLAIQAGSYQ